MASQDFTNRALTEIETRVSEYEGFVRSLFGGYDQCIDEYTHDLWCRQLLENDRNTEEANSMWSRIIRADEQLKSLLIPTNGSIFGCYPEECFWYWGYPPNSPEVKVHLEHVGLV